VDKAGTVKILDMGLARFTDESQGSLTRAYDQKMIGTVDYLSPEQAIDSHKVDERVDIYSLGCTLYFLLTGDAPFPQGTIPQRLLQHQTGEPADIRKVRPDCPEELIAICQKMMAKSADNRYQSAGEVSEALSLYLGENKAASELAAFPKQPPPSAGPSLNEDLDLAPLDDDPTARGRTRSAKETPPDDSKSGSTSKTNGGSKVSGASKSTIKTSGSSIKNGENSSVISGAHSVVKGPKSQLRSSSVGDAGKRKPTDLMDELLTDPKLPANGLSSGIGHGPPNQQEKMIFPIWLVIGMGVVLGTAVIATFIAWIRGGI
jgi:serine/threonine protein kinase